MVELKINLVIINFKIISFNQFNNVLISLIVNRKITFIVKIVMKSYEVTNFVVVSQK